LIYTIPSVTSPLQSLIHSSLGIHSLLKRQPLKHNVIDRDKVLVPPNWDSWGKIRVLRDGFDVEAINRGWSVDIEETNDTVPTSQTNGLELVTTTDENVPRVAGGAVEAFEETIRDPSLDALQAVSAETNGSKLEVESLNTQHFLATQLEVLDKIRTGADPNGMDSSRVIRGRQSSLSRVDDGDGSPTDEGRVNEHIGPVQFNMGGIQVDADDMLQRLKVTQFFSQEVFIL
jgi:dynein light intermediate chain 1